MLTVRDGPENFRGKSRRNGPMPFWGRSGEPIFSARGKEAWSLSTNMPPMRGFSSKSLRRNLKTGPVISERLLLPILIELSAEESCTLDSAGEALKEIGFEIEPVGEKLFAIQSVPSFIDPKDPKEMVRGILEELSFLEKRGRGKETIYTLLVTLACHSAVRGNSMLRREEIDKLVEDLAPFHASTTCPHGRPIFFFFPLDELKRQFKRK